MLFFPPEPRDLSVDEWIANAPPFGHISGTRTLDDRRSDPLASASGHRAPVRRADVAYGICRTGYLMRP